LGLLALVRHPQDNDVLYAGTTGGMYRSVDDGLTWQPWDQGWPTGQRVVGIAVDAAVPDTLVACSSDGELTDQPSIPMPASANAVSGTVMKSTDGGATWHQITTGFDVQNGCRSVLIDRFDSNTLYLATEKAGIFISRDAGATWSSWNEGLWDRNLGRGGVDGFDTLEFSSDGRLLLLGTSGSGVWRRPAAGSP
jgi:photosystem II stability/assembly factor-like uncharacterized protein